jgi:phage terminase large subunit-like protein
VRRALLSMARKNGKTGLIAAIVLVHLVGPEANYGQEIYSAANDREQAGIIYRQCAGMVEMDEGLRALVRPIESRKRLVCDHFGSFYCALSSDARTKHGLNPAVWIYDELAQAQKQDLYEALDTSQGAQAEPLGIVISTQAVSPLSLMSDLVDDGLKQAALPEEERDPTRVAAIYAVPKDADPFDESLWHLANPALGDFLSLEDMRAEADLARRLPSRLASFRNLRLNQQVDGTDQLLTAEDWKACGGELDLEALKGRSCVAALDLSARRDLTALTLLFDPLPGELERPVITFVWTPAADLSARGQRDKAPYTTWKEQGFLLTTTGATVDPDFIAAHIAEIMALYDIRAMAFDRWRIQDLLNALDAIGVRVTVDPEEPETGSLRLVGWGQGFRDMAPAVDAIEALVTSHTLRHGGHPVLTWAASNAVATRDAANNRKIDKAKARNRIDPFVALTMAAGLQARLMGAPSDYVEHGLIDVFAA